MFSDETKTYINYAALGLLLGIILICIVSSIYTVKADETAVVLRFEKVVGQTSPGLHFKLALIERVEKVSVKKVFKEEFGFRTLKAGIRTEYDPQDYINESLLLTGDLNSADVEWVIQYKIKDPVQYLFHVRNPQNILRDLSEAVMSRVVGDKTVTEVLTIGRIEIASEVKKSLQQLLDLYKSGLHVVTVTLQDVNPPDKVKDAFNEVNEAKQRKEQLINEAWRDYNQAVPKAKGLASQMISEAQGYAVKRVNEATGDADRFTSILNEYSKAKEVTRQRLYHETIQTTFQQIKDVYIIDDDSTGPIPLLQFQTPE